MPIMAKSNDEYTEVKAIKTPDGTEIDYVLSKVDNTYKRTYTATRELEDAPPLEFKSIKPNANLTDYRIYGQTFDGESVGDLVTSGEHAGEYKVLATVSNGTDTLTTPIYLPEQIKKVGDEAEYIDYGKQKFHRISGADLDVTLPALPTLTGTNVLSVGTEVQPSDMYIKGNFKMIAGGGE